MRFSRQQKKIERLVAKPPLPDNPERPSLATLPEDVLRIVTARVGQSSPGSLRSLAQVSSLFYVQARQYQKRELRLEFVPGKNSQLIAKCTDLQLEVSLSSVQHLIVVFSSTRNARADPDSMEKHANIICSLLPHMSSLRAITHFGGRIPEFMLATFENMPQVTLSTKVEINTMDDPTEDEKQYLLRLCDNSYLKSLDCQITYDEIGPLLGITSALKQLLLTSRGLRHLTLDIAPIQARGLHPGAMGTSEQYCGLGFQAGEELPRLESLVIRNYPFGREARNPGQMFEFNTKDYPGKGTEIDLWARAFDWSKLQRLQTAYSSIAVALSTRAISLKEIDTRNCNINDDPELSYLDTRAALESISIPFLPEDAVTKILRHAATVHELRIHQPESQHRVWESQALSLETLVNIQQHCGQLTDLCIDVARKDVWPYEMLDSLAKMRNLKRLQLWFELGVANPDFPQRPHLTLSSAKHIFDYLLQARRNHSSQALLQIELHCGDDVHYGGGNGTPTETSFWPLYNSTSFICQMSQRDDELIAGKYVVISPKTQRQKTSGHTAGWLPTQSSQWPLFKILQRKVLAFGHMVRRAGVGPSREVSHRLNYLDEAKEVACHGPRPRKQWQAHY